MSFAKPSTKGYKGGQVDAESEIKCPAYGCGLRATVRVEGGSWCCVSHAFSEREDWQEITRKLHSNDWLTAFIDDMQKMARRNEDWRGFARKFWDGADFCKPADGEGDVPYQNRMRCELAFRVGLVSRRPEPRIAQQVAPGGQFARRKSLPSIEQLETT